MLDQQSTVAEPRLQRRFIISVLAGALLFVLPLLAHWMSWYLPDRRELGPASAAVRFEPVELDPAGFGALELGGAWRVSADDPRFGGISALAIDHEGLLALADSGVVIRLPRPAGGQSTALLDELPDGPADGRFRRNRDSEALLRDPMGRGWWVAFETHHELWLYDRTFDKALARIPLGRNRWPANRGVEGLAGDDPALLLFPENARSVIRLQPPEIVESPIAGDIAEISDAAAIGSGGVLAVERRLTALGFATALVRLERSAGGYRVAGRIPLTLGPFDNVEALAIEPRAAGGARLWLMTDDNYQPPFRSLLVALDVPAG